MTAPEPTPERPPARAPAPDAAPPGAAAPVPPLTCTLASRLDAIEPLAEQVAQWCAAAGVPAREAQRLNLMLDELVTNAVEHGYAGRDDGWIELHLSRDGGADTLRLTLEDGAPPFDPTTAAPADHLDDPDIGQRPIGGLGMQLVRRLAAEWHYEHTPRGNCQRIVRHFGEPPPETD